MSFDKTNKMDSKAQNLKLSKAFRKILFTCSGVFL